VQRRVSPEDGGETRVKDKQGRLGRTLSSKARGQRKNELKAGEKIAKRKKKGGGKWTSCVHEAIGRSLQIPGVKRARRLKLERLKATFAKKDRSAG